MLIRLCDLLISSIAMVILFPFMLPIAVGLKLTGEHYIFYLQPRVGNGGKDFLVFKFATMLKNSPNLVGGVLTQKNDPRILPMGKFLRKTKINELPQLINIFLGQMSFVGPRPQARRHYELYSLPVRKAIDAVPPGLTGIGSVVFRDEESILDEVPGDRDQFHDTIVAPYKGELEVWWTANRTLGNYFMLIFLTAWALVSPRSKLWKTWFKGLPETPNTLKKYI
jgi:lipopolysaccharide/colanic/teichoic acid biosynthesis glycosyltransferase